MQVKSFAGVQGEVFQKSPLPAGGKIIKRVEAVDLFKFFVLFFMIQGHLFRAYLTESLLQGKWYTIHEILHGIVGPAFLFSAGFAAFLSYCNKKEQYIRPGRPFLMRLRRILFVIWCGYWMHMPFFSLRKSMTTISQGLAPEFLKADILQCIGVSLLLFILIALLFKNEKTIVMVSVLFSLLFFLLPPLVNGVHVWHIIDPYFDYNVSPFPLFPWAGFLFFGVISAYFYRWMNKGRGAATLYAEALLQYAPTICSHSKNENPYAFKLMLIIGIVIFPWYFFYTSVGYHRSELTLLGNLTKIGGIFLLLWFSNWLAVKFRGRWIKWLKKAGKEPLFVYVLHLFIIFGSAFNPGLQGTFKNSLNMTEALSLFFVILLVVFSLALFYNYLKEKHHVLWRFCFYVFWVVFFAFFILRRY